jgi:transposase, IS5 family
MIEMRRAQRSFGDGLIAEEVSDLREDWMKHADAVLADDEIVAAVYEALGKRRPQSRCRGRRGAPADMVLRLLVLKHIRNWSYEVLEREVRANLVYRDFTHVGGAKTPDAKTMGRWGVALGPEVLKQVHEGVVRIARDKGVIAGRRMRVDTTVVETDIHHPTDSTLLGGRRSRADAHYAEDHKHRGGGGNQAARPPSQCETAATGDRAGGTRQRSG